MRLFASAFLALAATLLTSRVRGASRSSHLRAQHAAQIAGVHHHRSRRETGFDFLVQGQGAGAAVHVHHLPSLPALRAGDIDSASEGVWTPGGLVVEGTVFNDANGAMAAQFVKDFNVGFPVGYASRDSVISYLSIPVMDRWVVPGVAVNRSQGKHCGAELVPQEPRNYRTQLTCGLWSINF